MLTPSLAVIARVCELIRNFDANSEREKRAIPLPLNSTQSSWDFFLPFQESKQESDVTLVMPEIMTIVLSMLHNLGKYLPH
jgi:hypothetical protein